MGLGRACQAHGRFGLARRLLEAAGAWNELLALCVFQGDFMGLQSYARQVGAGGRGGTAGFALPGGMPQARVTRLGQSISAAGALGFASVQYNSAHRLPFGPPCAAVAPGPRPPPQAGRDVQRLADQLLAVNEDAFRHAQGGLYGGRPNTEDWRVEAQVRIHLALPRTFSP